MRLRRYRGLTVVFADRQQAGKALAQRLQPYAGGPDVLVLGLPRGGVPVAHEVAGALGAPLDVLVVRKLGVPGHEELAMGAVASGGIRAVNWDIVAGLGLTNDTVEEAAARESAEVERREHRFRGSRPPLDVAGKTVIVVDDGVATGASARAAVEALRTMDPARVVLALPTAPADTLASLAREVDDVVCLSTPEPYVAVGMWYRHFPQVADDEVRRLLAIPTTAKGP
jgi:putative phosphoribosyl transferase